MKKFLLVILFFLVGCNTTGENENAIIINTLDNSNIVLINDVIYYYNNYILYRSEDVSNLTNEILIKNVELTNLQEHDSKLFFILKSNGKSQIYYLNQNRFELYDMDLNDGTKLSDYVNIEEFVFRLNELLVLNDDSIFTLDLQGKNIKYIEVDNARSIIGLNSKYIIYIKNNNDIVKSDLSKEINIVVTNTGISTSNSNYFVNNNLIVNRNFNENYNGVYKFKLDKETNIKLIDGIILNLNISSEYVYFVIEKKEEVKLYKTDLNFEELEEVYMDVGIDKNTKIVFLDYLYLLQNHKLVRIKDFNTN